MSVLILWLAIAGIFAGIMVIGLVVTRFEKPPTANEIRQRIRTENLSKIHRNYYR
jgi:hypothetical protein